MSYEYDADKLNQKLSLAGLTEVTNSISNGQLKPGEEYEIEFENSTAMNAARFLLYSFLKLSGLKPRFRVRTVGPRTVSIAYVIHGKKRVRKKSQVGVVDTMPFDPGKAETGLDYQAPSYADFLGDSEDDSKLPGEDVES